jgi:hypothetical protein
MKSNIKKNKGFKAADMPVPPTPVCVVCMDIYTEVKKQVLTTK